MGQFSPTFWVNYTPAVTGGEAVFIDTERDTWNMDPVALEKAFEFYPDVRLVVIAHLYGTPGKIDELRSICDKHNALIIEDAAESIGATYKGVQIGSFGNIGVVSMNGNKCITGSAGGFLLTNDIMKQIKLVNGVLKLENVQNGMNMLSSVIITGCQT